MVQHCMVYYILNDAHRVRTFPNKIVMERWIEKFERENDGYEDSYITLVLTGVKTARPKFRIRIIRWGE